MYLGPRVLCQSPRRVFQVFPGMTFFSEQKRCGTRSKSVTHFFFHPVAFSFFSRLNKLPKVTNYAAESATEQQRYLDEARACKHSGADEHTPLGRPGWVIWLDWTASVNPWGTSAVLWCVIGRLSGGGVCACVFVCKLLCPTHGSFPSNAQGALHWLASECWSHLELTM